MGVAMTNSLMGSNDILDKASCLSTAIVDFGDIAADADKSDEINVYAHDAGRHTMACPSELNAN